MGITSLTILYLSLLASLASAEFEAKLGVNYGELGNNLPTPTRSVELIKSLKAKRVKIYDATPSILKALQNTDIQVSIMLPNQLISNFSTNQTLTNQWVYSKVKPFYPQTKIRYLLVGNEILSDRSIKPTWFNLVPAMRKIKYALKYYNLHKIKVGTSMAMDVLESSFPPSNGTFRSDIANPVVKPMLQFLNKTKSFFFLDAYTYFPWSDQPDNINLNYALLSATNITYLDPVSGLTYTNLLDQMFDAVIFAMKKMGYPDIRLFIAETGWPNGCDIDQIGGNIYNAATYNRNVAKKFNAKPAIGTPARPGVVLPGFIFALYNENLKGGPGTERHFGLLYPNGTNIYDIDLSGKKPLSEYKPLPKPLNNEKYKGKLWCLVKKGANLTDVSAALGYACGQGNGTCDPIQTGGKCFKPNTLIGHAGYAFSSYWAQFKKLGGTCSFNGVAAITAKDPSFGSCKFPSVTL